MFLLGLLLPISFIPGVTGASIPTQWAVLSIALPILLRRQVLPSNLWLAFLLFCIIGTNWAPEPFDTVDGIWFAILWGLSFQLGQRTESPTALYKGLALGLTVSSALAIFQFIGYRPVIVWNNNVAGLLFNRTVLGSACALVILALFTERLWWYIPALLPGLVLSGSRGGWLVLATGLASRLHPILTAVPPLLALAAFLALPLSPSDTERLQIWGITLHALTWFGWSANSFTSIYLLDPLRGPIHLEFVHNDYLQLLFEYGLFALIPFSVLGCALAWRPTPVVFGFALLATFYFPLFSPIPAFLCCFALGHSLRDFTPSSLLVRHCRPDLLPGFIAERFASDPAWSTLIPLRTRTAHTES